MNTIDDLLNRLRREQPAMPDAGQMAESILADLPRQNPRPRTKGVFRMTLQIISSVAAVFLLLLYIGGFLVHQPAVPTRQVVDITCVHFASKEDACAYYTRKLNQVPIMERLKSTYYENK